MQLNKVHSAKTIDRVAVELGEAVDRIFDLAIGMETEDGIIGVYSPAATVLSRSLHSRAKTCKSSSKSTVIASDDPPCGLRRMLTII